MLSMWVIFLVARMVPPSFVDPSPKSKALIQAIGNATYSVGWLVGWWSWRAGSISQDTYFLYLLFGDVHETSSALGSGSL